MIGEDKVSKTEGVGVPDGKTPLLGKVVGNESTFVQAPKFC